MDRLRIAYGPIKLVPPRRPQQEFCSVGDMSAYRLLTSAVCAEISGVRFVWYAAHVGYPETATLL